MCLAIPAQITEVDNYSAIVDIMGLESKINVQLIENPQIGDYVLVHAGCAIQRIEKCYFEELQDIFQSILNSEEKHEQRKIN